MSKKCNSPGEFPGLVVYLGVFFRKFDKKSQNVTVRESLLYSTYYIDSGIDQCCPGAWSFCQNLKKIFKEIITPEKVVC